MKTTKRKTGYSCSRPTFQEILRDTRVLAAEKAWERARLASDLRHLATRERRLGSARTAAKIKQDAISRAVALAPERINVTIDSDYHVGLTSVHWRGKGRLHLPADADVMTSVAVA